MPSNTEKSMDLLDKAISFIIDQIGEFSILEERLVPEGIIPRARSVSWLIEQIIRQNLNKYKKEIGITYVKDPPHALTQYDCIIKFEKIDPEVFVNIKASSSTTKHTGRFDISKSDKLAIMYHQNPDLILLIATIIVKFNNIRIRLLADKTIIHNVAWSDIYVNPRNRNLQCSLGKHIERTNEEFLEELVQKLKESLPEKYLEEIELAKVIDSISIKTKGNESLDKFLK